jgi:hypothetical protein
VPQLGYRGQLATRSRETVHFATGRGQNELDRLLLDTVTKLNAVEFGYRSVNPGTEDSKEKGRLMLDSFTENRAGQNGSRRGAQYDIQSAGHFFTHFPCSRTGLRAGSLGYGHAIFRNRRSAPRFLQADITASRAQGYGYRIG